MSSGIRSIRVAPHVSPSPTDPTTSPSSLARRLVIVVVGIYLAILWPVASAFGAQSWTITAIPSTIYRGVSTTIAMTATNTSTTAADSEAIGCIRIRIPGQSTVSSATIIVPPIGTTWTISTASGNPAFVTLQAASDADRMRGASLSNQIMFEVTATSGAMGNWVANEYQDIACSTGYGQPLNALAVISASPVAVPDAYSTAKNVTLNVSAPGVLANDSDPEGDPLTAEVVTAPLHGVLSLAADGSFSYVPAVGYIGADAFTYRVTDGGTWSLPAAVILTITNAAPVAVADAYSLPKSTTLNVAAPGILANDSDANGDSLTAQLVSGPSNGTLSLAADGSFSYSPAVGFVGTDGFTYRASDGAATSADATVSLDVVNAGPVANPDGPYAGTEDTLLSVAAPGVLSNDTDADGDSLTAELVSQAANGTVVLSPDGAFSYQPAADFHGTDSFTYRANDPNDASAAVSVSIDVASVNDRPVAADDAAGTSEDLALVVAAPGILSNDTDADGDPLSAQLVSGPSNGTLALDPDGAFVYTPNADFSGSDSFTYQASDGTLDSLVATVSITVGAVNDPPLARPDAYVVAEDGTLSEPAPGVLANDLDPDGPATAALLAGPPGHGTLVLRPSGGFTYVPDADWNGTDTFSYRASDGLASSAEATVTITVIPVNDVPVAAPDFVAVTDGAPALIDVLANDYDADGDRLAIAGFSQPAHGTVSRVGSQLSYVPAPGYAGPDGFDYSVTDGVDTATGRVTVAVTAPRTTPTPSPSPRATPTPTPTPATVTPVPTPTPTAIPSEEPVPTDSPQPAVETPSPTTPVASTPVPTPTPQPAAGQSPRGPLSLGPLQPGVDPAVGFGSLASMLDLAWFIPAIGLGAPGLLIVMLVGAQVSGTVIWLPAVRRSLGTFGLRRRRRKSEAAAQA